MQSDKARRRWARAAAWARDQSLGPWGQLVEEEATEVEVTAFHAECQRIEALRDRILEVGEDAAFAESEAAEEVEVPKLRLVME